MICMHCGRPVEPEPWPGNKWIHFSAQEAAICDWLRGKRDDDDPAVLGELDWLL